jgi:DNA polymerase-1
MTDMPRRTLLLDSSGVIHRCFHGYPPRHGMHEGRSVDVGALTGYFEYVRRLMDEFECERLIHVLDPDQGSAYRFGIYPEYKANRSPTAEALKEQKALLPLALAALGQQFIQFHGVESDDVIAILARKATEEGDFVMVVSQDKDMFQLVDDRSICMARYVARSDGNGKLHQIFDEAGVLEEMGVRPDQIADYLAIVGDSSDNIPGVHKAGPKTAQDWLSAHGNLAALMTACDTIKGKQGEYLRAAGEDIWLYQKLTTLLNDIEGVEFPGVPATDMETHSKFCALLGAKPEWSQHFPAPSPSQGQGPRFR